MTKSKRELLNSPLELGMRAFIILLVNNEECFDLERLTYYDYICTHLGDYNSGFESLHPSNPYRLGEIMVKRDLIKRGLILLAKKDLIKITYNSNGILYKINEYGKFFFQQFNSSYSDKLLEHVTEASNLLRDIPTKEIKKFFNSLSETIKEEHPFENVIRGE